MSDLLKKADALPQNPSIGNIISLIQEIVEKLDKLLPEETVSISETKVEETEDKPKKKKKNV